MCAAVALAACGRIGFDAFGGDDAGGAGSNGDARTDAPSTDPPTTTPPTVQFGSSVFNNATELDFAMPVTDLAHSALFFSVNVDSNIAANSAIRGELRATGPHFERQGSMIGPSVSFFVVTWDGWNVQRGTTTLPANTTSTAFAISPVDMQQTFAMQSNTSGGASIDDSMQMTAILTGPSQLQLQLDFMHTSSITSSWQTIEVPSATVLRGSTTLGPGEKLKTASAGPRGPTLLFYQWRSQNTMNSASHQLQGRVTGDFEVTFERDGGNGTLDIDWTAISLAGANVQHGRTIFGAGATNTQEPIAMPSSPVFAYTNGGSTDRTDSTNPGSTEARLSSSGSSLTVLRGSNVGTGEIPWEVVELQQ